MGRTIENIISNSIPLFIKTRYHHLWERRWRRILTRIWSFGLIRRHQRPQELLPTNPRRQSPTLKRLLQIAENRIVAQISQSLVDYRQSFEGLTPQVSKTHWQVRGGLDQAKCPSRQSASNQQESTKGTRRAQPYPRLPRWSFPLARPTHIAGTQPCAAGSQAPDASTRSHQASNLSLQSSTATPTTSR